MSITPEQHSREGIFTTMAIIVPSVIVGIGAPIAYAASEVVQEYMEFDQLAAVEIGAVLIFLSGIFHLARARRLCTGQH